MDDKPVIGLEAGVVRLVAYTSEWKRLFEQEKACLQGALGAKILDIQHVGSTAIPGMPAKPIIDIAIAVEDFEEARTCIPLIEALGYEYRGEMGIPRRHYFRKGAPRTFHIHMSEIGSMSWQNHLLFRDYLSRHPEAAKQYAELKQQLAAKYPQDREAYLEGKAEFIEQTIHFAHAEAGGRRMERVVIIGNSGSGKSYLGDALGGHFQLPVVHLDGLFWESGGYSQKRPKEIVLAEVAELARGDSWIAEGVFGELAQQFIRRADTLIWLDMDWETCKANLLGRGPGGPLQEATQATQEDFTRLLAWAADYWVRDGPRSYTGHEALYSSFVLDKIHLTSLDEINDFIQAIVVN